MTIDLHYIIGSPPCRAVMIVAERLGLKLNLVNVDLFNGEQNSEEFLKINPRKLVPVLNDNGFVITESRVIITYLINQHAPGHDLYPADAKKRAVIDRALFLTSELWERFRKMVLPLLYEKKWPPKEDAKNAYFDLLKVLETLMGDEKFLASDKMSIADISFICDVTELTDCIGMQIKDETPKLSVWMDRMKNELPEYQKMIETPNKDLKNMFEERVGFKL